MITVVIFDADKVVINNEYVPVHLEKEFGITQEMTKDFFEGIFKECVVGKKDLKKVLPLYLRKWGWSKSTDEFIRYWHTVEHVLNEDLLAYIQHLRAKGIICCLATNQEKYRFGYMLKEMGFKKAFDKVYASSHIGFKKPDMQFYTYIVDDLGITHNNEVLFWDDSKMNVDAAKTIGMQAEVYTTFEDFKEKMNKYNL